MALATRRPLLYSLFDIIIELFALTKHCESSWEEGKIRGGGRLLLFFHKRSKSRGIEISGSFKRARSAREGSWTASRGLNSGCYRGLLAPPAPTCTNATTCHLERGGGGGERRQSGALEKRLSAVKNAAELLVCLARYKRPGSWCAFRNKHAATARPPVLWRNPRSEKKERNVPGKNRLPFSSSYSYTCSSGLHSRLTIWSQFFEDWTWTNRSFFLSLFRKKSIVLENVFHPGEFFVGIIAAV